MKKNKSKTGWIILLLFLLYCSASGNYLSNENEYLRDNASWLALIDLTIASISMMIIPFIWRLINKGKFTLKKGKNICLWNSIILFIVSIVLMISFDISFIGGIGAIIYYFINKWLFVNNEELEEILIKCDNCGALVKETDKYCRNCNAIFDDDSDENDKINDNSKISSNDMFKCDNCGALVKETDIKCPNCGEKFDEGEEIIKDSKTASNMDQKYSDLTKLKKLLDKDIISKEEFEKEKKKILNNK